MTSGRWQQVTAIFHAALTREAPVRGAYLAEACRDDLTLRAEVDALLAAHDEAGSFGAGPVFAATPSVRLEPGAAVGAYSIEALIDVGGMGEVYRARDTRLGRAVALKLLPPEAADEERRQRFAREAQIIASLNHPNIVTIHSVEQSGGLHFLTMELVIGRTLREVIPAGGLPLDRLLHLAVPLADAVGAAHAQGVIHRDLKPGNVMVTPDGQVKVLDFGLAKLNPSAAVSGESIPTAHDNITNDGRVMGTVAYMSPEQAEGREVDHRSDIFSIGVLLYELAVGQRPFTGDTTVSLLSSILKDTPPFLTERRPDLPRELGRVIRRCLAKDPSRRYQSALDLRNDLDEIRQDVASGSLTPSTVNAAAASHRRTSRALGTGMGLLLLAAAAAAYLIWQRPVEQAPAPKQRTTLAPLSGVRVAPQDAPPSLAISPDGRWVAYHGISDDPKRAGMYLQSTSELEPQFVRDGDGSSPFFSPDSKWLGFWANGTLWKMRVEGGRHERLCDAPNPLRGASWGDGGTIVFSDGKDGGLRRVSADGGEPAILTRRSREGPRYYFPHTLPGSHAALVMLNPEKTIAIVSLETGEILRKLFAGSTPRYVEGFLVFRRLDSLYAAPFDIKRLEVTGDPQRLLAGVTFNPGGSETSAFDVSLTGALVFTPPLPRIADAELVWLDRQGRTAPLGVDRRDYSSPSLDHDGTRLAVRVASAGDSDLWTFDIRAKTETQLTRGQMMTAGDTIVWSSDGRWIVFSSVKPGFPSLFRVRADGGEAPERLTTKPTYGASTTVHDHPSSVRGSTLMFSRQGGPSGFDLLTMPLEPPGTPEPFLRTGFSTRDGHISPDGRWVAYTSSEAGGRQIFVRAFSDPGKGRFPVASDANRPAWSHDGKSLFYLKAGEIWTVQVTPGATGADFQPGPPVLVVGKSVLTPEIEINGIQPSADGNRFLVVKRPQAGRTELQLVYVPRWLDEVKEVFQKISPK